MSGCCDVALHLCMRLCLLDLSFVAISARKQVLHILSVSRLMCVNAYSEVKVRLSRITLFFLTWTHFPRSLSVICHECYKSVTLLITIFLLQHFPQAAIQHKLKGFRSKLKEDVEVASVEYKHTHWLWTRCHLFCVRSGIRFQWTVRAWFVKSSVIFSQYLWCLVVSWFPEFDIHCSFTSKNLGFIHTKWKRTWKRSSHKAHIVFAFTFAGQSVWMNSQLIVWWKCIPKNAMVLFICVYVTINNVWLSQWYISNDVFPFFLPPISPCYHFVEQRRQGQI